jgi:hypothetical protein
VTAASLIQIAKSLPSLRELYLYADAGIDNKGFAALADPAVSVVRNLTLLDVCGCSMLEDESLVGICELNHHLRYLNLSWCLALTDHSIVDGIPRLIDGLTLLSLFGNLQITDKCVDALATSSSQLTLNTLDLNGCKHIINRDYDDLKIKFPNVRCFVFHS